MNHLLIASDTFWHQINDNFGAKGGVYRLHCFTSAGGGVMPINRLLGTDQQGILYIGCAASYLDRVVVLKKSLSPDYIGSAHGVGRIYKHPRHDSLRQTYPYDRLCLSLVPSDDPKGRENELLDAYCLKYGEPPPMNSIGRLAKINAD